MTRLDTFMLHIHAAVAEKERALIASRTRADLAAKQARGEVLGSIAVVEVTVAGRAAVMENAKARAANVIPIARSIQASGISTLAGVADALNARGIPTARGGSWHASSVRNLLARAALSAGKQTQLDGRQRHSMLLAPLHGQRRPSRVTLHNLAALACSVEWAMSLMTAAITVSSPSSSAASRWAAMPSGGTRRAILTP